MSTNQPDDGGQQTLRRFWQDESAAVFSAPVLCFSAVMILVFWAMT